MRQNSQLLKVGGFGRLGNIFRAFFVYIHLPPADTNPRQKIGFLWSVPCAKDSVATVMHPNSYRHFMFSRTTRGLATPTLSTGGVASFLISPVREIQVMSHLS